MQKRSQKSKATKRQGAPRGRVDQSFRGKERVDTCATVEEALLKYYKRDRLDYEKPGDRERLPRLVQDRVDTIAERGFDILASHHDNVTGSVLWLRKEGSQYGIYRK